MMDELWAGTIDLAGGPVAVKADIRSRSNARERRLFQLQRLIQRIAPHIHHWNRSVFFSIEQLKRDTGWQPEYSFKGAVAQTWDWMKSEGIDKRDFDFTLEDGLLKRLGY